MKNFNGKILFLDRSDINTDEIIPAKYLTELTKAALKPYCLEDLSLAGFDPKKDIAGKSAVVTRANFGCGSSREHAPWVLECNGINIVIAENFARIFRQNMFNCGLMAISLDRAAIDEIFKTFAGTDAELTTDIENRTFTISNGAVTKVYPFTVGEFDLELGQGGRLGQLRRQQILTGDPTLMATPPPGAVPGGGFMLSGFASAGECGKSGPALLHRPLLRCRFNHSTHPEMPGNWCSDKGRAPSGSPCPFVRHARRR